jgi:hypothetical protein
MAEFDPSQATLAPGQFDPSQAVPVPPAPPRGPVAEVATGLARGALVGLPTLAGQALQYATTPGSGVHEFARALIDNATERGQAPGLMLQPGEHGMVTNALASGAEMLAPAAGVPLAIGAGASALGASPLLAGGAAIAGAGALFGAQQGQATLEKAEKAGVAPDVAQTAARLNAAQTFASQTALGFVGGKLLGRFGQAMGSIFQSEGAPLAQETMAALTGTNGTLMPFLKQLPLSVGEAVGLNAAQAATSAAIENNYGIDNTSPAEAAKDTIGASLGMTALMTPLGLVARAAAVRSAQTRTFTLANGDSPPEIRSQLAGEYAAALQKVDPQAAGAFRLNANIAIQHRLHMDVDSSLLQPGAVTVPMPEPEAPAPVQPQPSGPPLLGRDPQAGQMVVFPDGTTGFRSDVENYVAGLPEDQQVAARAKLLGYGAQEVDNSIPKDALDLHAQVKQALADGGVAPAAPMSRKDFYASDAAKDLKGQERAKAYRDYLASPDTQRDLMRQDADAYDKLQESLAQQRASEEAAATTPRNPPPVDTQAESTPGVPAMAAAMTEALKKRDVDAAFAQQEATKKAQLDAIQNIAHGEALAQAAERGELKPDVNAPKTKDALVADWHEAMAANDMDTKAQARVPFEKRLDALGIDKMATHQEQIDAIRSVADDKKVSQGMRDRMSMLADKLQAEMPAKEPEPVPVEKTEAAAAKTDTQVAAEPGTQTGRQAVLEGLKQPGATRVEVLGQLRDRAQAEAADLVAHPDEAKAEQLQTKLDHLAAVEPKAKELDAADALGEPPAQAAALGENIAPRPPGVSGMPDNIPPKPPKVSKAKMTLSERRDARARAQAEKEAAPPPSNEEFQGDSGVRSLSELADETADRIAALRAEFTARMRAGEKLSPLEQERFNDLTGAAHSIGAYTEGKASPSDAAYVNFISHFVYEASKPYTRTKRGTTGTDEILSRLGGPTMEHPDQVNPALLVPAAYSHKVADVLAHLSENGSHPWVRELAAKLEKLLPETGIVAGREVLTVGTSNDGAPLLQVATYNHRDNMIRINAASESTLLHEATHAATVSQLDRAAQLLRGAKVIDQRDAQLKAAALDLTQAMHEAARLPGADGQYGMTDVREFVAELHANAQFREFLKQAPTLWGRVVNAIRRLLGMSERESPLLERALDASEPFFSENRIAADFSSTPAHAADAFTGALNRVIMAADNERTPFAKLSEKAFAAVLPLKTVDFIAHQIRGIPEMVASGFSRGVDAFQAANTSHRVASEHLNLAGSRYIGALERSLRETGDAAKAQQLQREMAIIGGEASRVGFDYRKNGRDNIAADPTLNAADKPYMDEIHRRFTQLQRQHPELAKALEDGERLNRAALINKVSTLAANIMDARAGVARRLAAELQRMDPADARLAQLQAQVKATTLESTFAAQHSPLLDFMDRSLRTAKNPDPVRFADGASAVLGQRLANAFQAAAQLPVGTPLREHMKALADLYFAQVKNPYFSLGRDGDYFVKLNFKGVDAAANARIQKALEGTNKVVGDLTRGDSHAFFRVDSIDEARALHDRLLLAGQDKIESGSSYGLLAEHPNEASGVAPALRSLLSSLDDTVANTPGLRADQAALMKASIARQVMSMLPETAARSANMQRRGVPGYDANFANSFARRAGAAVHETAGLYTNRAYMDAARQRSEAIEQLNKTGSLEGRVRAQQVDSEIGKRFADMMKPTGNSIVSAATSLSHSFYLGLSPAFFLRTMAQPWHRGIPITGSKFGYAQAVRELAGATPVAMKIVANSIRAAVAKDGARGLIGAPIELKDLDLPANEQAFLEELHLRGVLDLGESQQLMKAAEAAGTRKYKDLLRMASVTAQLSEMSNRLVMGLSAFRLAEQRPGLLGKETSTDYAIRAINLAMDNFDPANTDRATGRHGVAGPLTPLFTQFMKYALQTMQQIARTTHDGFFGQDKSPEGLQRATEARREFAGLMATTAMVSGALGLPFANAFAGIYNNFMRDEDKPEDVRISIRNWADTVFGHDVAGLLMHGLPNLAGVDSSTFGLQGILPGSDFLASRMLWKDRSEAQARSMLGPAVSLGLDLGDAFSKMSDGYWLKGIEAALPVGLRTYFKAEELARLGHYTDSKGNPIPLKPGAGDVAWRALGFQTADKAEQGEAARDFYTNQQLLKHRRDVIVDNFYKGVSDPSKIAQASQDMQAFNAKNPTQPITGQEIGSAIRGRTMAYMLGLASGTGVSASKRQYPALTASERFAAMPTQ